MKILKPEEAAFLLLAVFLFLLLPWFAKLYMNYVSWVLAP